MGKNSMLQNMYLTHQELFGRIAPTMNGSPWHDPYSSYDEFYKDSEIFWGKLENDLDSIIHEHPTLSPKYINYIRHFWDMIKAEKLAQASNYLPDHKLPKAALDEIVEKYWRNLPRPYTAYCGQIFEDTSHQHEQKSMSTVRSGSENRNVINQSASISRYISRSA